MPIKTIKDFSETAIPLLTIILVFLVLLIIVTLSTVFFDTKLIETINAFSTAITALLTLIIAVSNFALAYVGCRAFKNFNRDQTFSEVKSLALAHKEFELSTHDFYEYSKLYIMIRMTVMGAENIDEKCIPILDKVKDQFNKANNAFLKTNKEINLLEFILDDLNIEKIHEYKKLTSEVMNKLILDESALYELHSLLKNQSNPYFDLRYENTSSDRTISLKNFFSSEDVEIYKSKFDSNWCCIVYEMYPKVFKLLQKIDDALKKATITKEQNSMLEIRVGSSSLKAIHTKCRKLIKQQLIK